eukprot:2188168-Amphidinium_carterae.1
MHIIGQLSSGNPLSPPLREAVQHEGSVKHTHGLFGSTAMKKHCEFIQAMLQGHEPTLTSQCACHVQRSKFRIPIPFK